MAIFFVDGVDHYTTGDTDLKWTDENHVPIIENTYQGGGPNGEYYIKPNSVGSNTGSLSKSFSSLNTLTVSLHWRREEAGGFLNPNGYRIFNFQDRSGGTTVTHLILDVIANGAIRVRRGDNTELGRSDPDTVSLDVWHRLEMKATIHNTAGAVEVRVDENPVIVLTNVDTQDSGSSTIVDTVTIYAGFNTARQHFTNIVFIDDTGTDNTGFIGGARVITLYPNADTSQKDFTPDSGSTNYDRVNESPQDDDTSYVESNTVAHKDLYEMDDLTVNPIQIFGLSITAILRKDDSGSRTVKTIGEQGGTEDQSPEIFPATAYRVYEYIIENDPASGGDWTKITIDNMKAGYVVQS